MSLTLIEFKNKIEKYLNNIFLTLQGNDLLPLMRYSVENGGKRLRPSLMLLTCQCLGVDLDKALPFACALEIIHCSSLVHDDLPALDNDDYRRGKPSCHKQFGEAQAILCGDALLNFAYEICHNNAENLLDINCIRVLSDCAGANGMLGGQYKDIVSEKQGKIDKQILQYIQVNKTAKLIIAPVLMASELSDGKYKKELYDYALNLGIAFQITDDVLDQVGSLEVLGKTIGKDQKSNKLTDLKVYGLEQSKLRAITYTENAIKSIENVKEFLPLKEFAQSLIGRVK